MLDSTFDTSLLGDDNFFCNCLMLASYDLASSCYNSKNEEIKLGALTTFKYQFYFFLADVACAILIHSRDSLTSSSHLDTSGKFYHHHYDPALSLQIG